MRLRKNPEGIKALISAIIALSAIASASATTYYLRHSEGGKSANAWTTGLDCWTDETPNSNWPASPAKTSSGIGGSAPSLVSADDGFVVPVGNTVTLRLQTTPEWNGKHLQLGGVFIRDESSDRAIIRHMLRGENVFIHFKNDGLILAEKGRYNPYYSGSTYNITGTVTVAAASRSSAAEIQQARNAKNATVVLHDKFKSTVGAYCKVNSATNGLSVTFRDTSEYLGTLIVTNLYDDATASVTLCSDFPGTLEIDPRTTLKTSAGCKINSLSLGSGVVIDATAGGFSVTGALESASVVTVRVNVASLVRAADFSFTSSTPLSSDKFAFVGANGLKLNDDLFDFVETPEGATVRVYPVVTLTTSDNKSLTEENPSSMTNSSHWTNAEAWPDSATMPGDCHYALSSSASYLRTAYSGTLTSPEGNLVFPGLSLTLPSSTYLVMLNPSFACTNLVFDGGQLQPSVYVNATFSGKMTITENGGSIYQYIRKAMIKSEISGPGDLRLTAASGSATSQPFGYVCLDALNTNYTGAITATIPVNTPSGDITTSSVTNKITPRFDRNYMHLQISDKRNLGGPLAAVNQKALTIRNMSRLELADGCTSLVLDEPTRGIYIRWVGRFLADSGQTMKIASPLAVHGTMWKEGAGTLELANPQPTFGTDAAGTTPDAASTNRMFRVEGGTVKIASGCAVNGLDVVVKNGASLALDLGSSDADLAAYGIRNELTPGVPFAADGAAEVQLNLVLPENYEGSAAVPVATVKATDADSVESVLVVRKPTGGGGMRTLAKSRKAVTIDETACVTFTVDTTAPGLVISIR